MEAYEDMHKLRKYMYDEYMERLQHEVDEKRKKIYLKSEKARKLYEAKEIEQVIFSNFKISYLFIVCTV